jgi:hypothetical protein
MLELDYMQQHVDAATVKALMNAILANVQGSSDFIVMKALAALQVCELPAAAQLSREAVAELITGLAALKFDDVHSVNASDRWYVKELHADLSSQLCKLPGAQQLSSEQVVQLLQATAEWDEFDDSDTCRGQLWQLLAAKQLSNEQLLAMPNVPLDVAKQLVSAGMRVSYAQLLAAAHSMVAGVEVWVQAQQQLGIQTDLPAAAVAICCGEDWVSGGSAAGLTSTTGLTRLIRCAAEQCSHCKTLTASLLHPMFCMLVAYFAVE